MSYRGMFARGLGSDQTDGMFIRGLFLDSESGGQGAPAKKMHMPTPIRQAGQIHSAMRGLRSIILLLLGVS